MSEAEKQEGQKTVVAFITGLLIGGLLVWVFSASPEQAAAPAAEEDEAGEMTTSDTTDATPTEEGAATTESETATETTVSAPAPAPVVGNGKLAVQDQGAGTKVTLGETAYPSETGWIVVRDFANDTPGKILGAARFNTKDGLLPKDIELVRPTIKGSTYMAQFYTEDGDKKFVTPADKPVEGGSVVFTAN